MTAIDLTPRSNDCMVTPCDHFFHTGCLQRWMDIKMECPTCRRPLPPAWVDFRNVHIIRINWHRPDSNIISVICLWKRPLVMSNTWFQLKCLVYILPFYFSFWFAGWGIESILGIIEIFTTRLKYSTCDHLYRAAFVYSWLIGFFFFFIKKIG